MSSSIQPVAMEPPPGNVQGESSLGLTCASPVSRSVSDSEDLDGEDLDGEDLDGEDLDREDLDGEDLDGEDLDGEDLDGKDPNWEDLDWEDDYMMWGQLADAEIAVTQGLL